MFIKSLKDCNFIIAKDNTPLVEFFHPEKDGIPIGYSIAYARIKPGKSNLLHKLMVSEAYIILEGEGYMYIGDEVEKVGSGMAVYIPPGSEQKVVNVGETDLVFLCIVEPAWQERDETILE
ncbi:cupin domain-containing protein [bacterium]|nr:cupin domain-containing protein [bacterium]